MDLMSRLDRPETARNPYSFYATLRQNAAAHWSESLKGWALFRYADCTSALSDPNLKAERMESVLRTKFPGEELPPDDIYHRFTKNVMMYADPPKHTALRRSTNPAFTRAAHEHYSAVIREVARDLVGSLPPGPREIDGVADLCARLPVMAAVRAFGLPEEDLDVVLPIIETIMTYWSGPKTQPMPLRDVLGALTELHTYARELVEGRRGKVLPDTVIARLVAAQVDNTDTTPEQTLHQLVLLIAALFAPTTSGSASSGTLSFALNPGQIERVRSDARCAENVANEVVRYNASNQFTWRVAARSFELAGVMIEEGQLVIPFLGAANRDPSVFDLPDVFDVGRANSARHLSFGAGIHSCLGRQIASLELQWFFIELFDRFPKIRVAGEPVWNDNLEFRALTRLPLAIG